LGLGRADYEEATNPIMKRVEEAAALNVRGLSATSAARALGVSTRTVYRRWRYARE